MARNPEEYVTCAYCRASGVDPFGQLSALSTCQVCGGTGEVRAPKPRVQCAFCKGKGAQPSKPLTCTGCKGTGWHTVKDPHVACPECSGTGKSQGSMELPCLKCKGAGVIHSAPRS